MSRKRHRVALRPKVRGQRLRRAGLLLLLAGLGLAAFRVVKDVAAGLPARLASAAPAAVEGAPEPLAAELSGWLAAHPKAGADELKAAFPVLAHVEERRSAWRVVLRRPLARTADGALLGEDGALFKPYPGLEAPAVEAEVGKAGEEERRALAAFLAETPVAVSRMRFVSAEEGWEARLSDGTRVLWGGLRFTREKAERLRQALDDARARQSGDFLADLRYFEDGRILLRKL